MNKVVRDLVAAKGRIALMVVAVGVSLMVFGGVLFAGTIVDREFDRNYLSTDPASATLLLRDGMAPDRAAELAAAVRSRPGVTGATMRAQFTAQFQPTPGTWSADPLQVFVAAPGDRFRVARFDVDRGSWPPPKDGILLERDALKLFGLHVGERLTVKTPDGSPVTLTITGTVHDPSLADAKQEQKGYAYVSTNSLPLLGEPRVLNQLKITAGGDRDAVVATGRGVAGWLARSRGVSVDEIQVPQPGRQPHRDWVDLILLILYTFGSTTLVLSGVLVATMLNRLLSQQIPQLGIMKALGARSRSLILRYSVMTLLVSTIATVVAIVPSVLLGRVMATKLLDMYDMAPFSFATPWWTYAAVAGLGVLLAPLLALAPVVRACRTTVREAMDHHGATEVRESRYGWVSRIRGLDRASLMGMRNMFRRRARLALLVGLLAAGGALFLGGANTLTGLSAFEDQAAAQQHWDADVGLAGFAAASTLDATVSRIPGVTHVETWTRVPVAPGTRGTEVTDTYPDQGHGARFLEAVPPTTSMVGAPVVEGRWLRPGDTDAVVLNRGTEGGLFPDAKLGDVVPIAVNGRVSDWRVVGFVTQKFAPMSAFVTTDGFAATTGRPGRANRVELATGRHDAATQSAVADAARKALTDAGVDVQTAMPVGRFGGVVDGHVYASAWTLLVIAVVIAVVGYIGMASAMSSDVLERTREFGVMHAIGARASAVRRIVMTEGLFAGVASCLFAVPLALGIAAVLNRMIGTMIGGGQPLPLRVSLVATAVWVVAVVAGAVVATLPPARRASRLTVRDALSYV